jgi:hypothetical protein
MIHRSTTIRRRAPRLGDVTTQIVGGSTQIAGTALATVQAASSAGLLTLSGTLAASIPIAGAVIAVGTLIFSLLHNSRGLQQDAETTQAVNQGEAFMKQNLAAWQASSKSLANQTQALQNYDAAWQAIVKFCGNPAEGSPGERCISERSPTGIYPYQTWYRDPIAKDPLAGAVDRAAAEAIAASVDPATVATSGPTSSNSPLLLFLAVGLIAASLVVD